MTKVFITPDNDPFNPRAEYDNLGTMVCFHGKYLLGDKDHGIQEGWFNSWDELEDYLWDEKDAAVVLPLYLYDHGGITMSCGPFLCPWDSGQVGFIYISKAKVRKEYSWKYLTKKRLAKIEEYLRGEVKEYDMYLTGDVWGYQAILDDGSEDSCWGYFGLSYLKDELELIFPGYELVESRDELYEKDDIEYEEEYAI